MKLLDFIKNDSILIIPNNIKNKVLLEIESGNFLLNIKFMSLDEFKKEYYFNYKKEAILFIMDNYKLEIDISKTILELLYYIDINKEYKDEKLIFLQEIKSRLIKEGLLVFNPMFKDFISNKEIYIYGYSKVDAFLQNMLDEVNAIEIDIPLYENANTIRVLNTLEDEVEYVFDPQIEDNIAKDGKITYCRFAKTYDQVKDKYIFEAISDKFVPFDYTENAYLKPSIIHMD